jgi:hypothetical protein
MSDFSNANQSHGLSVNGDDLAPDLVGLPNAFPISNRDKFISMFEAIGFRMKDAGGKMQ